MSKGTVFLSEGGYENWREFFYKTETISQVLWESLNTADIGFWKWNGENRTLYWSEGVYRILGLDPSEEKPPLDLYRSFIPEGNRDGIPIPEDGDSDFTVEQPIVMKDGSEKTLKIFGKWSHPQTNHRSCDGIIQDITDCRISSIFRRCSAEIFDSDLVGIMISGADRKILFVNQAFTNITGYDSNEVLGQYSEILQSDRHDRKFYGDIRTKLTEFGKWQGESWSRRKNGEIYPEWLTVNTIKNMHREIIGYIAHFVDLSELREKDARLAKYSYSDILTGSGNKEIFFINLDKEIKEADETHSQFAVAVLDINRFQSINESLGYATGDRLLQLVAQRIGEELHSKDFLARFNGDSFYILIPHLKNKNILTIKAKQLVDRFRNPFSISEKDYFLSVSLGVAIYPDDAKSRDILIGRAEQALQKARMGGINNYAIFSASPSGVSSDYATVENELRLALEDPDKAFMTKFQPKLQLSTGKIVSFEALVRWRHPVKGVLPPYEFIHTAEDTGLIVPIDMWVFREICRLSVEWRKTMGGSVKLAMNFSAKQYHRKDLLPEVGKILKATGANPHDLIIEITETGIMTDFDEALTILSGLKEIGFSLYVDDFGTGYSSLAYLRKFPVDAIKIDKSFIDNVLTDTQTAVLVKTIIAMGHSLGMEVVAEGVETPEQKAFLAENDCDIIQGYIISTPIDTGHVVDFLQSWGKRP